MKVLYVSEALTNHDLKICRCLSEQDCQVHHLRLTSRVLDRSPYPDQCQRVQSLPAFLQLRPEVVLAGPIPQGLIWPGLWARLWGAPLVAMSWGSDLLLEARRSRWAQLKARLALALSQAAFGDCQAVKEQFMRLSHLSSAQILTFPWGIAVDRFCPGPDRLGLRQRLNWGDRPVFISTRNWEPTYAIEVLLEAFEEVLKQHPEARMLLLGDGSRARWVHGQLSRPHLSGHIHCPGRLANDELVDYFRAADFYVTSSRCDGSSISLLEAMGCGLPALVPEVGGNPEWVEPDQHGWLYPVGQPLALAQAMTQALALTPTQRQEMGLRGRWRVEQRGDWSRNAPRLAGFLRAVVSGQSRPADPRLAMSSRSEENGF